MYGMKNLLDNLPDSDHEKFKVLATCGTDEL